MPSIVEQTPYNESTANGVATVFPYTFELLDADDLVVYADGVVVPSSDYSVSGVGDQAGGNVTFSVAPADGVVILRSREIALERDTDYQYNGDLREDTLDRDFNRMWQALQGVWSRLTGALRAPYPEQLDELPAAEDRALQLLGFDADGQPIAVAPTSGSAADLALRLADTSSASNGDALVATMLELLSGGVGRTQHEKNEEVISILDLGGVADGDGNGGGTNNYSVISAALAAVSVLGKPVRIDFPSHIGTGIYRCDTGLSIDVSLHSLKSTGAMLDFYNMGTGDYALTLTASANLAGSGSFYAVTNAVDGLIFKGREGAAPTSPPTVTRNGIYIAGTVSGVVTGYEFRNCIFRNFTNAISLATTANAQAITFTNCNYLWNTTNVLVPLAVSGAAGSKMLFQGGFMTGGVNGFDLRSTVADVTVAGMNVEAMTDNFFYHLGGILNLRNLHVETGTDVGAYVIRQQSGQAGYASVLSTLSVTDCDFIIKSPIGGSTPKTVAAFDFSKLCSNTFIGGSIVTDSATYTTSIFDSDASGEGIGSLTIIGTRLQKTSATVAGTYPSTGLASTIDVNDQWGYVAARAATDYTCLNKFELTATATNLTTTGFPTYTITGTRFKNRVEITLRVNANGGTTAATAGSTYFAATGLPTPSGNSSGSVVTATGLSAGTCLIGPGGGGRIYVGTSWAADGVDRVFTVSYPVS